MSSFNPDTYGLSLGTLLQGDRRRALDAGQTDSQTRPALHCLTVDSAFVDTSICNRAAAECCVAGVWLLADFLDESHNISQRIDTPEGSYWHAIMHRREGDFSNAKYWYRHVGKHPIFEALAEQAYAAACRRDEKSSFGENCSREWDPFAFVDLCQSTIRGKSSDRELCLDIQQAEWELLFDYCYRKATGG